MYFFLGWIARSKESAAWTVSDAVKQRKAPYAFQHMPLCGLERHEKLQWREWTTNTGKTYVDKFKFFTLILHLKKAASTIESVRYRGRALRGIVNM